MGKRIRISLGKHFEKFIHSKIKAGHFKNESEVINAGLRLLEAEELYIALLRKSIDEGINSGHVKDFDAKDHLLSLQSSTYRNS